MSNGGANVGELRALDSSVKGVDDLDSWLVDTILAVDDPSENALDCVVLALACETADV